MGGREVVGAPKGAVPKGGGAQNVALFLPSPATLFLGSFRGILVVFEGRGLEMWTFGVLGLSCEAPTAPKRRQMGWPKMVWPKLHWPKSAITATSALSPPHDQSALNPRCVKRFLEVHENKEYESSA